MENIADKIMAAIEDAHVERQSNRLGSSQIGHECERRLWLSFHWARKPKYDGRILRIFETGHRAESRIVADLRTAGMTVLDVDENTGEQFCFTDCDGHLVSKIDGVCWSVPGYEDDWYLLEIKTANASSFRAIQKSGCKQHMAQIQISMLLAGLSVCLYVVENKNTSELYVERVPYDDGLASKLWEKARAIIGAPAPPSVNYSPAFYLCKMCHFAPLCHGSVAPDLNCRTCCFSSPVSTGNWECERKGIRLDVEAQQAACRQHLFVPPMFGGAEQYDFNGDCVKYVMKSGHVWANANETGFPKIDTGQSFDICTSEAVAGQDVTADNLEVPF